MDNTGNVRLSASLHAGIPGASAYQIAVAHGYVGTEEEWLASLHALINGEAAVQIAAGQNVTITLVDGVLTISATGGGGSHPYLSLERKAAYLYDVSFAAIPPDSGIDAAPDGGCTSYVSGGKLYRNLDLGYTDRATFRVRCSGFEGAAVLPGLTDTALDDALIGQLPYHLLDGVNAHGIMVSEHVLFNDWAWHGTGSTPLTKLPYLILTRVKSMATLADDLADVLPTLCTTPALDAHEYLLQFLVTDGTTTCAILPPTDGGDYAVVDITDNPKLTNFRWVAAETVTRADLQRRPTGVERWNMIPAPLEDLRFTAAYESPDRLSEFIGLRGTTKDSTDAELLAIYADARAAYLDRTRDGETWQTMHSAVYAPTGMESLCVQEDWTRDYSASGGGGTFDHRDLTNRAAADQHPISAITGLSDALAGKQPTGDYALRDDLPEALADLTADAQHRTVTDVEKSTWNAKQSAIDDLDDIREGAAAGATAVQPSALTDYALDADLTAEAAVRVAADGSLQSQIDALASKSDVVDVVGTYAELLAYDTAKLLTNDVVKVLDDTTHSNQRSYYRWIITGDSGAWSYIGSEAVGYTKAETDALLDGKQSSITDLSTIRAGAAAGATAYQKPQTGVPKSDLAAQVKTSLGLADTALQEHQSLTAYRTAAEQDDIDADKLAAPSSPGTAGQVLTADGEGGQSWQDASGGGDTAGVVAPAYSQSETYDEGDLVIYESLLYRAKQDISTPEAWTPAHWEQTTVDEALKNYVKYSALVIACTTKDGVTVTGQTVTVRKGSDDTGPIFAVASYDGQPVTILVPAGFDYFVSASNSLSQHFDPTTVHGIAIANTINVTVTYNDVDHIESFLDIKAALNAGIDLSGLVGASVTATRQNRSLVFDVADYDAVDESVWLLLHDTMPNQMAFEPKQALAWFGEGLPAGSYYFTHSSKNYYFTLTKPIPEDGQLMATTSTFSTYVNQDASTALESGSVSQTGIAGATSLGTTATGNLNHMDRVNYGSNNAGESGLFTWLNSDAEPNTNLPRLNKFSRPYSSGSDGGFLRGFDAADLECLEDVEWTIQANNVYEAPASMGGITAKGQQYTITGKIGLAKFANVGLSGSNPWDLYVGATNTDRIKYYNGGARIWWVFDANAYITYFEYFVYSSGGSDCNNAYNSYGVVPACKIKKSM